MTLRTLFAVAAMLGALSPALAHAEDVLPDLVREVTTLAARKEYAAAARVAASGAAREDLDHAARGLLGGLAARNFKLAYETGGDLNNLCELRTVMRLVAPLDAAETGALKLAAAEEAEAELQRVAGDDWQQVCDPLLAPTPTREPATVDTTPTAATKAPTSPPPPEPRPGLDRRRVRAGVGVLTPGLLLFAPMAGVLVYRHQGEARVAGLRETADGRKGTAEEQQLADSLGRRYTATTAAAAVLGATGAALVVTGVILLATGREQRSRVAVAPWGARGVGGLVLGGRF